MSRTWNAWRAAPLLMALMVPLTAVAGDVVCVKVKLEIPQRLTLERTGFDASLTLTNELVDAPLTSLRVDIQFRNASDDTRVDELFFTRVTVKSGVTGDLDGTGTVAADSAANIRWLIVPVPGAGGNTAAGRQYRVRAAINYITNGQAYPVETFDETIFVEPQPEIVLDYALPRWVDADDPFTAPVEPSIPFELAVRVANVGAGVARNLRISSLQPRIVENEQGALISFQLIGTFLNNQQVANTLTLRLGDIAPQRCGTGAWAMVTSLKGEMTELSATYTHREDLGGAQTSVIRGINTHRLFHRVQLDSPGKDNVPDLLVDFGSGGDGTPDAVLESDCFTTPVVIASGTVVGSPDVTTPYYDIDAVVTLGWNYVEVLDPADGQRAIRRVERRSDGRVLHARNAWLDRNASEMRTTHLLDQPPLGSTSESYRVYVDYSDQDTTPPITILEMLPPFRGTNPVHVAPYTIMTLRAVDDLGTVVRTEYRKDGGPWQTAGQPFYFAAPGSHTLEFRSVDNRGNEEPIQRVNLVVDSGGPVADVTSPRDGATYLVGELLPITFSVTDDQDPAPVFTARIVPVTGAGEVVVQSGDVVDLSTFAVGSYEFEVRATDWLGQARRTVIRFIVQREPGACENVPDGAACDDRRPCTIQDTCQAGTCAGVANPCDDQNACTDDSCDVMTGCVNTANTAACDDGNACTTGDVCANAACVGASITCADTNPCTTDACDPMTGCTFTDNADACDDGNACTENDSCSRGACAGALISCDDGNTCTDDSCDSALGCVRVNNTAACDDDSSCTTGDTCANGACVGQPVAQGTRCDDGRQCTAGDTCNASGVCTGGSVACAGGQACDESTCCGAAAAQCDDGDECTDDSCGTDGGCSHVTRPGCADGGSADAGGAGADAGTTTDGGAADAGGSVDAGGSDAGAVDAGAVDAGTADAGRADAGVADAGRTDASVAPDGGGRRDAGTVSTDGSVVNPADGGGTPPPPPDEPRTCGCRTSEETDPAAGVLVVLAGALLAARRRKVRGA